MKKFFGLLGRNKHRLATCALAFGFLVDIVTFRNLNLNYALILLGAHLFIVAFSILVLSIPLKSDVDSFVARVRSWIPVAQQYSMGNLLSAFLILYSASGSLAASWPFFVLVAVAAVGNETLKLQKYRLPFQTSLFCLNLVLFSALLWPVLFRSISTATFLVSVLVAFFVFALFRRTLWLVARAAFSASKKNINRGAFSVLVVVVLLYFTNIIPPIPLTLSTIDFYYSVARSGDSYIARDEMRSFVDRFLSFTPRTLVLSSGAPAYVFTAISAPAKLDTTIVHRWQYFNENTHSWVTKNSVEFPIVGGRQGGYRAFSLSESPAAGRWRVSVETTSGKILGRSYMTVEHSTTQPETHRVEIR